MIQKLTFLKGVRDGFPVALGYISISFAFGMLAVSKGLPVWTPILLSLTSFTGTGQFAGMDMLAFSAGFAEIACTILVINLRYMLLSLSLLQKLDEKISFPRKLLIAFGNADEIYAVAMQQTGALTFPYMMGVILCAYSGWAGGTILGTLAGNLLPASILSAMGIALYAMFIALIIPPARDSKPVLKIVLMALGLSLFFRFTPGLRNLSSGWVIILCGVISSAIGAALFPAGTDSAEDNTPGGAS